MTDKIDRETLLPCPFCGDDGDKGRQDVTQMTDDALVLLSLTGRPQILTMPWHHARDRFVSMFGPRAVKDCMDTLGRGHEWVGKSANHPGVALSVELAKPTP